MKKESVRLKVLEQADGKKKPTVYNVVINSRFNMRNTYCLQA